MLGPKQGYQTALVYGFSHEGPIPADRTLRSIEHFVDLSEVRREPANSL
jgi:hypothetical protein